MKYNSVVEAIYCHSLDLPDKLCVADRSSAYSYSAFFRLIGQYAACFASLHIGRQDKVILEASQTADFPAAAFALHLLGAVFVPVERNCSAEKILSIAGRCTAALIVSSKAPATESPKSMTAGDLKALVRELPPFSASEAFPAGGELCEILFSTGTTGKEKGIMLSHRNEVAAAENIVCGSKMDSGVTELIPSPLNHSHGLRSFYANMLCGGTVILHESIMDLNGFFRAMEQYRVNAVDLVPSALSAILKFSGGKLGEYRDQMRYMEFGSEAMLASDRQTLTGLLPGIPLYNYYGSTESGRSCVFDFNSGNDKHGCIGRATVNSRIVIMDETRKPIVSSPERTGLIASAGPMNMVGYWQDAEETARAGDGTYIYSSDEAYIDSDGDIILLGRTNDVINIGGKKVSPAEIENAAVQFPAVADCGCTAVSDSVTGQAAKLFLQLRTGAVFERKAFLAFLSEKLEPYKVPKQIEIIPKIPRTYNGKLIRRQLKDLSGNTPRG
jgi:acyl-CoA synthetase (AMP-forming)/AMP-acid ligase II